ncbi:MAG: hypothetical protein AB7S26_19530 [Sandaracinaceae bacterium]
MTKTNLFQVVLFLAMTGLMGLIGGCGSEESDTTEATETTETSDDTADEAPSGGGGGGACSRIAACCRAYVEAMGGSVPANTCDAYNQVQGMPETSCEQTIAGYRTGLSAMQKAIPADCN